MGQYNLKNIRVLLTDGFDDQGLRRFIYDTPHFRSVYDQLGTRIGKAEIIDLLIGFAEQAMLLDTLLDSLKDLNPAQFEAHKPYDDTQADSGIEVPIVLVVMNQTDAQELEDGKAFEEYPTLQRDFEQLKTWLDQNGIHNWVDCYKESLENWQPLLFFDPQKEQGVARKSIKELVEEAIKEINEPALLFEPFINIHTLNNNRERLKKLRQDGCVVIIDSISMRHPKIQRLFNLSALDAHPKTYVITISPAAVTPGIFAVTREMTIVIQLRIKDMEFVKRRDEDEDYGGCEETHEMQRFKVWLRNRVKKMYPSKSGIQNHMNKNLATRA